jgi:hypothetical protein
MVTALVSGSRGTVALHLASQPRGTLEKLIAKGRVAYILRLNGGYHSQQSAPAKGLQLDYRRTGAVVGSWVVGSGSRVTIVMLGTMTVLFFVASAKFPQLDEDSRRAMLAPVRT